MFGVGPGEFPFLVEGRVDGSFSCGEEGSDCVCGVVGVAGVVGVVVVNVGVPVWVPVGGAGCGWWVGCLFCRPVRDLVAWDASVGWNPPKLYIQPGSGGLVQRLQKLYQDELARGITRILQGFQGALVVAEDDEVGAVCASIGHQDL